MAPQRTAFTVSSPAPASLHLYCSFTHDPNTFPVAQFLVLDRFSALSVASVAGKGGHEASTLTPTLNVG